MTENAPTIEHVDVAVVGARLAGSALAITLARAGRSVVAIDRASFPSDSLSTHVLFAGGVAELKRLGALARVEAAGAPKLPIVNLGLDDLQMNGYFSEVDGIDYGLCTRRPQLDLALVQTAREAGAEIREKCKLQDLIWRSGRVAGIRYIAPDGTLHELHAKLVVGADGRDSAVAGLLGVAKPYRTSPPGRGLAFFYVKDPVAIASGDRELRNKISAWRIGKENGYFFPTNAEGGLALFMSPVEDIARFRKNPKEVWEEKLAAHPILRERLVGTEIESRLRSANDTDAYFRISSGPGWALVGDAGHFKDPVIAQGIRDALHYGRVLGEMVADALHHPERLDRRLRAYEIRRDRGVVRSFYWGQKHTRAEAANPIELEFYREAAVNSRLATDVADTFSRKLTPQQSITYRRQIAWTVRALRRPDADVGAIVRAAAADLHLDYRMFRDLLSLRRGGRVRPDRTAAWGRDGWTGHAELGREVPPAAAPAVLPAKSPAAVLARTA